MSKYFCLILLLVFYLHFGAADSSANFDESLEIEELDQVMDDKDGALTDFFHSYPILGEKRSGDKKAKVGKPLQLIPVEDFLSLTEHGHPLPSIDLVGSIEATEDLQSAYVPTDDDGIHEHNLNDPISDILKLYDPTEAVVLSGLSESLSSPTDV